jgi:hypothetical protein
VSSSLGATVDGCFVLDPTFQITQGGEGELPAAHTAHVGLAMPHEVAQIDPERGRCFPRAQEQPRLWALSFHVIVDRETVETAAERRCSDMDLQ